MFASVTTFQAQPGKLDELIGKWRKEVKPFVEGLPGLHSILLLTNAETERLVLIGLYASKADAERTMTSGDYQRAGEKVAGLLILETVEREAYQVSVQVQGEAAVPAR